MLLAGALSEKLSILTDLHNCFDQLGFRDLAIVVLIHSVVLSLERLCIIATVLFHDLRDQIFALVPIEGVVLVQVQCFEHLNDSCAEISLCNCNAPLFHYFQITNYNDF